MGKIVERVARAICIAKGMNPETCVEGSGAASQDGINFTVCYRRRWEWYIADARAAITAMREPSGIVLQSAIVAHEACVEDGWGDNAMLDAWQAGIDAALVE